jgi:pyruvate,water dikinase
LRVRWLRRQVGEASRFLRLREQAKAALLMLGGEERRVIVEASRRLVASSQLETADDVELLSDTELTRMVLGAPQPPTAELFRRRTVRAQCLAGRNLPVTLIGAPDFTPTVLDPRALTLEGWAASPGVVEGTARVLDSLADGGRMARGDVLVAEATDPSWTPLLLVAGGLVLEEGGPLSHGAIVAREFGVPAVLNVPGAASLIADGEQVEVDGFAGVVRRRSRQEEVAVS